MKRILLCSLCAIALASCQAHKNAAPVLKRPVDARFVGGAVPDNATKKASLEITGGTSGPMDDMTASMDPNVQTYSTDGPAVNPLMAERTHSVLDNTTAGGYTVFDESVTVYPLPGEDSPAYMPAYAVPPLEKQYDANGPRLSASGLPNTPIAGTKPMGLASAGMLPPVKNVDVPDANPYAKPPISGAVRQPLTLTAPAPVSMQPLARARAPMLSPFQDGGSSPQPLAPISTVTPAAPNQPLTLTSTQTTREADSKAMDAGRRSSPMLTGY